MKTRMRWIALGAASLALLALPTAGPALADEPSAPMAGGWVLVKYPQPQPACTGVGWQGAVYYDRLDCGFGWVPVSETTPTSTVEIAFVGPTGVEHDRQTATYRPANQAWQFSIRPGLDWVAGLTTIRVVEVDS